MTNRLKLSKAAASKIAELVERQADDLNESAARLREIYSEDEFKSYQRAIATVIGTMFLEILEPLWEDYPELAPESLRQEFEKR